MGGVKNSSYCTDGRSNENKFVIMVDDTEECKKREKCDGPIPGIPIQQVFIDLSDCKEKKCKEKEC
ncbi:hypothetical protein JK636_22190 [Clostridium sp. YIM B02515]|uniref:Uncharacterized protein n=1 Tax=Clostridium rhizosphaerae TaxID=2803861 RepID=A0ABS1TGR9_9CLOT|nr:hypothetical protein [Clostridium rhizosphaerae]MBL4938426.1 hypothetical protein [Clostridium rhizosphaerae]